MSGAAHEPSLELQVRPGDLIAGKYRVERTLGKGGMGVVVAATHVAFGDKVAIKLLLPRAAADPGIVERFVREGRAARSIRSQHVVQVTDVDTLDSGAPFMVMEHLDGVDLSRRLRRDGTLGVEENSKYETATARCLGGLCSKEDYLAAEDGRSQGRLGRWVAGVGAVALTAGVVVWLTAPTAKAEARATVAVTPSTVTFGLTF